MLAGVQLGPRRRGTMVVLFMVALTLLVASCSGEGSDVTLPEVELPEVELPEVELPDVDVPEVDLPDVDVPEVDLPDVDVPEVDLPESAPEEVPAPAEGDGSGAPIWVVVLLGLIIVGFIAYFGARSGSRRQQQSAPAAAQPQQPSATPPAPWKEAARSAYGDARWLYEEMTLELATWRGDALFEAEADPSGGSAAMDTAHRSAWNQLPSRMGSARDALYRIEAAGDPRASHAATALVDQLNSTRSALDRLADARRRRRKVEADSAADSGAVADLRSAESRSADDLAAERRRLGDATANLSGLI